MNKVVLMGRLTKNPEIKYAGKDNDMAVARYTLAVNRRYKRDGEQEADFISCVIFGKSAEFAQKYLHKGMRIVIGGRISTGSYKDKDGKTIYTTDLEQEKVQDVMEQLQNSSYNKSIVRQVHIAALHKEQQQIAEAVEKAERGDDG